MSWIFNNRFLLNEDEADIEEYGESLEPPCSNELCDGEIMERYYEKGTGSIVYVCPKCGKEVYEEDVSKYLRANFEIDNKFLNSFR